MSIFAISDLHLSTLASTNKSMEVFGRRWDGYMTRIKNNWERLVTPSDTVIIPGDISWALSLDESVSDLKFIASLPGRKLLGKGNHDFWWGTMRKHYALFERVGITGIDFIFNNAFIAENLIIAGTRGWYYEEDAQSKTVNADFEKLTKREAQRLRASLEQAKAIKEEAPDADCAVFMHFPPFWNGKASEELMQILHEYSIRRVYFGHIHGNYTLPPSFDYEDVRMTLISADYLDFIPKIIRAEEVWNP